MASLWTTRNLITLHRRLHRFVSTMSDELKKFTSAAPEKRALTPMIDENGFKMKKISVDAQTMSAYQKFGEGGEQGSKDKGYKNKTMNEEEEDAKYKIVGPMRKLEPYYFTYMTYCKLRWRDRKLLDVFTEEFRLFPESYYKKALDAGRVLLNNKVANVDSYIRNGDMISHRMHRHEPAVSSRPIKIVHEDDEIIVIDKPSGIPVHPTGRYRHNTVTMILKAEHGGLTVHPCNRLDRLTSGLMILAKTAKGAENMVKQIREREISKEYIAKVVGEFPLSDTNDGNDYITVDQPLKTIEPKLAFNRIDPDGKPAVTKFKRLSYDGKLSLVLCKPLTGRTHQIRVHLQYLGHPIANDPLYSSPVLWGVGLGKDNKGYDVDEVLEKLNKIGKTEPATSWLIPEVEDKSLLSGEVCEECGFEMYQDPGPNDLDLWLHAYKYAAVEKGGWCYQTELPEWALEDHKLFMELALKEADKCEETQTAFSVGALLVKDNKVLSSGYSRELPGNTHAEQCALEKWFAKNDGKREVPMGSTIYTTMEPCSERLSGNEPCVDRIIASKRIISCFVGVMEPKTFIQNNTGEDKLAEQNISYIHIPGYEKQCLDIAFRGHEQDRKD